MAPNKDSVMSAIEDYESVWDAIAITLEQNDQPLRQSGTYIKIIAIVKKNNWTQAEAADNCRITQSWMNDLL